MFLPQCERPSFTPIQNRQIHSLCILVFAFLDIKLEDAEFCTEWQQANSHKSNSGYSEIAGPQTCHSLYYLTKDIVQLILNPDKTTTVPRLDVKSKQEVISKMTFIISPVCVTECWLWGLEILAVYDSPHHMASEDPEVGSERPGPHQSTKSGITDIRPHPLQLRIRLCPAAVHITGTTLTRLHIKQHIPMA